MRSIKVLCPHCQSQDVVKNGFNKTVERPKQKFQCRQCRRYFQLDYTNPASIADTDRKIITLMTDGNSIGGIRRILGVGYKTIYNALKKKTQLKAVNPLVCKTNPIAVEIDEHWSDTGHKGRQCWTFYAFDRATKKVVAFTWGRRTKRNFKKLLKLLAPFHMTLFYTDGWRVYRNLLPKHAQIVSKKETQQIERQNLTFRTRIRRLQRKTICFSKKLSIHKLVIALFINLFYFT